MKPKFNPWPYGIVLFFVLLFCCLATVVIIASTHRETLVSADYYEQELKYQKQIDATAHGEKSGASIRVDGATGKMLVTVPAEHVVKDFTGKISFYRANDPGLDREFVFAPGADGTESFDTADFATGAWRVRVAWAAGGQDYFLEQKIAF